MNGLVSTPGPSSELIDSAMRRAFVLATNGPARGLNPQVGCVILDAEGVVLAEGWHRGAGTAHAEVDALSKLEPGQSRGATAVVTLEPCNHHGRTGPCSDALIDAGIAEVYFSVADPGAESAGGAAHLRTAGVTVTGSVLAAGGEQLLGDWLRSERLGRPVITLKWASSLDGRTAAADGTSQWITGADARADVHLRRSKADAIVVGTGTALADDPSLTARRPDGTLYPHQPVPVVIGERPIHAAATLFSHPQQPVFISGHNLEQAVATLFARGIRSLFIEGGPTLASAFVAAGLVDEYLIYLAPTLLGGPQLGLGDIAVGTIDEQRRLRIGSVERLGDDILIRAVPKNSTHTQHAQKES